MPAEVTRMPLRPSYGVTGKYVELPDALLAEVTAFAAAHRLTFKQVVVHALTRHLRFPPPAPPPQPDPSDLPLPAGAGDRPPPPGKRGPKPKSKKKGGRR
jgi:hypothetical protein